MNYIKIKILCSEKDTINGAKKRHPTELETIFATHVINKELVSRPHKSVRKKEYRRKISKKHELGTVPKSISKWPTLT